MFICIGDMKPVNIAPYVLMNAAMGAAMGTPMGEYASVCRPSSTRRVTATDPKRCLSMVEASGRFADPKPGRALAAKASTCAGRAAYACIANSLDFV